jgi:Uma2 family endonuclease
LPRPHGSACWRHYGQPDFHRCARFLPSPGNARRTSAGFPEQFLDWLEPGIHADLIAGQIFRRPPVPLRHANVVNFLCHLMGMYIEEFELGELHRETVAVRLGLRDTFLPDLSYFTNEQVARLGATHAGFAPTFVIEVLSPATARRDRGAKFSAYEAHGVQEYWLIDPDKADHHFYRRAGDMFGEYATGNEARIDARV